MPDGKMLPMYRNSELNRGLKLLTTACGIDRKPTFHRAKYHTASI